MFIELLQKKDPETEIWDLDIRRKRRENSVKMFKQWLPRKNAKSFTFDLFKIWLGIALRNLL